MSTDFWRLTATELLSGYARGDFSPVEVLNECLERIERLNPLLHAYLSINTQDARRAAKSAERVWGSAGEKPLLCGVPVSVKDTIEMQGMPTTYGSLAFKDNYQEDSEIVLRLRRAGAVILGKTNTPEFALLAATRNRLGSPGCNPWKLERTCGGSSGGAAAAVAAGLGQLAVGTDSGGSIRLPAAYNGIFGLKPTYQRIPSVQRWRAAPGRSHNGPLARTVRDGALLLQALAGFDARDPE
ncbi:MAG: amidase, partial [Steroidobacteraceae bacterium]